ncbi:LysR family transcriptional regulator [Chenggangzhangella methanolivorans]|uniref:LysR family transcriptional regulator n=1 Tax=Chenggangzhangella methanolivorans TaxID=1437009 RepID=UPI003D1658BB
MTTTISFSEMQAFVAVVTEESFTAAAERLETDKARVSRIVQRIEEKLGARLLNRSTRRLSVTEVGRDYFERVSSILAAAEAAEAAVAQQSREPKGRLKITATPEFGTTRVDDWIATYLRTWPKVTVETVYSIRAVDIIHEGIDVAIRIGALQDSELSARKLGDITYGLYASPGYLKDAAALRTVDDLKRHDLIMKTASGRAVWTLANGDVTEKVSQTPRCARQHDRAEKPCRVGTGGGSASSLYGRATCRRRDPGSRPARMGERADAGPRRIRLNAIHGPESARLRRSVPRGFRGLLWKRRLTCSGTAFIARLTSALGLPQADLEFPQPRR